MTDLIDELAGIRAGSPLDTIRRSRPETRTNAQASYNALFDDSVSGVSLADRWAIAAYVAGAYGHPAAAGYYATGAAAHPDTTALLEAGLAHAELLVERPRDATAAALQELLDAGWTTTDIVTLSQLVAFLSFQVRVISGLELQEATAA